MYASADCLIEGKSSYNKLLRGCQVEAWNFSKQGLVQGNRMALYQKICTHRGRIRVSQPQDPVRIAGFRRRAAVCRAYEAVVNTGPIPPFKNENRVVGASQEGAVKPEHGGRAKANTG